MYISLTKGETELILDLLKLIEETSAFNANIRYSAEKLWNKLYKYKEKQECPPSKAQSQPS